MSEKTKKDYRVYTVKTIITEYAVDALDDQDALWSCLNNGVVLSEDEMSHEPFLAELRNGGDRSHGSR